MLKLPPWLPWLNQKYAYLHINQQPNQVFTISSYHKYHHVISSQWDAYSALFYQSSAQTNTVLPMAREG